MTKTEHLQFLILMLPTLLILAAAAVSMADLDFAPPEPAPQAPVLAVQAMPLAEPVVWDDRPAE